MQFVRVKFNTQYPTRVNFVPNSMFECVLVECSTDLQTRGRNAIYKCTQTAVHCNEQCSEIWDVEHKLLYRKHNTLLERKCVVRMYFVLYSHTGVGGGGSSCGEEELAA